MTTNCRALVMEYTIGTIVFTITMGESGGKGKET
jgi:hypothetical protein